MSLIRPSRASVLLPLVALALAAPAAHAQTAYILGSAGLLGDTLISFDLATPGTTSTLVLSGAVTQLDGIDFRVSNGLLYGYQQSSNSLVTVNTATGVTTLATTPVTGSNTSGLGIDFNPVPDLLRLVNVSDQNLRINPTTGATIVDGTLAYAAGDVNAGINPLIVDAAYINNDTNAATGTKLYYIDFATDTLVTTDNPNGGVLDTVGSLGVDTNGYAGLDIFTSAAGENTAYALLNGSATPGLYTIDLVSGAATLIGNVGGSGNRYGLAITPVAAAVAAAPEPGTIALLLTAGLPVVGIVRRRVKCRV